MGRLSGRVLAVLFVVVLVAAGAAALRLRAGGADSANRSAPVTSVDELAGRWAAVNATRAPAALAAPVVLTFDGGRVSVQTGCNTGGGTVSVEDSRLVLGGRGLALTEMACLEEGRAGQEAWVVSMLEARPRLERSGPYLYLHWGEGERYWLGLERSDGAAQG